MKYIHLIFTAILFFQTANGQTKFIVRQGNKANYTIEVPSSFNLKETIGANIDLKYADKNGASIVTTVKKLPTGVRDEQIVEMSYPSNAQVINQFEANGMEDVNLIKRGFITINEVKSYFIYYTANVDGTVLYFHSLNQFKNGNMINLTVTCEYANKASYMPHTFRVVNSLKHHS